MGIGEAVAKGFTIAKKSLGLVLVLFVFGAVFSLLNLFLAPQNPDPDAAPSPALLAAGLIFIFITIYLQAGSMAYVRDAVKNGSAAMASFTAGGAKYYLRLFLLGLAVSVVIGVCVLLAALCMALLAGVPVLGVPLAILFAALGVYFVVLLFFSPYAAVVDDKGVGAAMKASMKLVKKNILKILGAAALLIAIGFGIGLVLGAVLALVSFVVKAEMPAQVIFAVLSSFVNAFLGVMVTGTFMNIYLSLPDRNNT